MKMFHLFTERWNTNEMLLDPRQVQKRQTHWRVFSVNLCNPGQQCLTCHIPVLCQLHPNLWKNAGCAFWKPYLWFMVVSSPKNADIHAIELGDTSMLMRVWMHEQLSSGHNCHGFGITTALLMITSIEVDLLGKHHLNKGGFCRQCQCVCPLGRLSARSNTQTLPSRQKAPPRSQPGASLWLNARKSEIKKTPWELWRVKDEDKESCMYIYAQFHHVIRKLSNYEIS